MSTPNTYIRDPSDADIKPWQLALKKGDCFYYLSHVQQIVTWGEVIDDPTPQELMPNYRKCVCYSRLYPKGVEGYVHISVVHCTIPRLWLEKAKKHAWPHDEATFVQFAGYIQRESTMN